MTARTDRQKPRDALVEIPDDPGASTARSVRHDPDRRTDDPRPTPPEMIRAETGGEIVDTTDRGHTPIANYPTSGGSSDTHPQPPFVYRVKPEKRPNGEETLHWSFLGDVTEPLGTGRGGQDESLTPQKDTRVGANDLLPVCSATGVEPELTDITRTGQRVEC